MMPRSGSPDKTSSTSIPCRGQLPDLQHPLNRPAGFGSCRFGNVDFVLIVSESCQRVFEGDFGHMRATQTAQAQDVLIGVLGDKIIRHAAFGKKQVVRGL